MRHPTFTIHPIGRVISTLVDRSTAPKQGDEGAPDAWIEIDATVADGIRNLRVGEELLLFTWLDRAQRDVLLVHPRHRFHNPPVGVFSSRSPDRPNPIGLHQVTVLALDGLRIQVSNLEALDGTPVVDIKPLLGPIGDRWGSSCVLITSFGHPYNVQHLLVRHNDIDPGYTLSTSPDQAPWSPQYDATVSPAWRHEALTGHAGPEIAPAWEPVEKHGRDDRKVVAIECHVDGVATHTPLRLSDLSLGGGFVEPAADVQRGERITVTFSLDGHECRCPARVAHVQPSRGFGFAFFQDELPEPARLALARFIDRDK